MEIASASEKISVQSADRLVPGGFWRRFLAVFLDGIIVAVVTVPVAMILGILVAFVAPDAALLVEAITRILNLVVVYFYYGHFYSTKGATPGKMVLNLRVINSETGKNLTYGEAFMREVFGKLISALPLLIGYIVAAFRDDKKAFHDMIFKTQVLQQEKN